METLKKKKWNEATLVNHRHSKIKNKAHQEVTWKPGTFLCQPENGSPTTHSSPSV